MTSSQNQRSTGTHKKARSDALVIGTVLKNRYRTVSYLGRGGMSNVYKALDSRTGATVAVKVLHSELLSDETRVKRFFQEAKTYRNLRHKHIIKLYDFFTDEADRHCIVMEYMEGKNLSETLDERGKLTVRRAIKIFTEICDALGYAHKQGIVHRDLKPSNIALVEKGGDADYVKILDFGIAKLIPSDTDTLTDLGLTQTGEIVGSPLYMSPEQCMAKTIDLRSDIYSLGCLMYEALTGQPPLMGQSIIDTMQMHMSTPPKPFREVRPDLKIPDALERVVLKALAKKPEQRYQSMQELRDALEGVSKLMDQEKLFSANPPRKSSIKSSKVTKPPVEATKPQASMTAPNEPALPQKSGTSPGSTSVKETTRPRTEPVRKPPARKKEEPKSKEAKESKFDLQEKLNQLKELNWSSPVLISGVLLVIALSGAGVIYLFNSLNLGALLSMQTEEEGLTYFYKPHTKSKSGLLYLWIPSKEEEEGKGRLVEINTGKYNLEDRAAYTQGAGIGDFWQVKYHKSGNKNILDEAKIVQNKSSEDLRQIVSLIKNMYFLLTKDSVDPDKMMNYYTDVWSKDNYKKMVETWGKENLEWESVANPNGCPKNNMKIESFEPDLSKASVLVRTTFWITKGPRYMRLDLIKKDGKKWLINKVDEISPEIWQSNGVSHEAVDEEAED